MRVLMFHGSQVYLLFVDGFSCLGRFLAWLPSSPSGTGADTEGAAKRNDGGNWLSGHE